MPAVLVHGVPDTHRLWDALRAHLRGRDVAGADLPGFGTPLPPGFEPTKESYVDWLIAELERVGEPVDLVGHDWGSLLVQRVGLAAARPDPHLGLRRRARRPRVRLARHGAAVADARRRRGDHGHDADGDALAEGLAASGIPTADAAGVAARVDDRMKTCILAPLPLGDPSRARSGRTASRASRVPR